MNAERFQRAMALFEEACRLDESSRAALLEERCGGDADLRREIETLLKHDAQPRGALREPGAGARVLAAEIAQPHNGDLPDHPVGSSIHSSVRVLSGDYRIIRVIGEGGMGVVYEAEQARPRRTVALKALRPGYASRQALKRFEHEAQVLGRLHHPGIAQIYEAGAADASLADQAYFAMEYVRGLSLTEHADFNALDVRERLWLMVKVCEAVQHAHQRGVIHRDLKPGNILVDESGQPKVLDFGVARLAPGDALHTTMQTQSGQLIGTLAYMSPEQVGGDPAETDTRSDVYALGVILYQLLTGKLPHDFGKLAIHEAARIIAEQGPRRLGAVDAKFRGDLEIIVAKAMERDKSRRYQSAAELGADIQRHLNAQPIAARQDSQLYIVGKLIRRYRHPLLAAALVMLALSALGIYTAVQAQRNLELARIATDRSAQLERSLYFNRIGFAHAAHLANDSARMRQLLEDCPEPMRGWEWHYLHHVADVSTYSVRAHGAGHMMAQLSGGPNVADEGSRIVTWDNLGALRIWNAQTFENLFEEPAPIQGVNAALNSDGTRVLIAGTDYPAQIRPLDSAEPPLIVDGVDQIRGAAAFSPDGSMVFLPLPRMSRIVDAQTGERIADVNTRDLSVTCAVFTPDSAHLLTCINQQIVIWNARTGRVIDYWNAHEGTVRSVAVSPDGAQIVSGGYDSSIRLWDFKSRQQLAIYRPHQNKVQCVAFSPCGRFVASGSTDRTVCVIDLSNGSVRHRLHGHDNTVSYVAFDQSGDRVLSFARDGMLKWWDLRSLRARPIIDVSAGFVKSLAISPDAQHILTASGNGEVSLWSARTGARLHVRRDHTGAANKVRCSPDGRWMASAGLDGTVRLWPADQFSASAQVLSAGEDSGPIRALAFDPSSSQLAAAGDRGIVCVWDVGAGALRRAIQVSDQSLFSLVWHNDGDRIYATGERPVLHVVDVNRNTARVLIDLQLNTPLYEVAMAPDSKTLAICGEDAVVRLLDIETGQIRLECRGHAGAVHCVAFHPDGTRFATGSFDNLVKIWSAETGDELLSLQGHIYATSTIAFSPDGRWLASGNDDATVRLWGDTTNDGLTTSLTRTSTQDRAEP